jgi:hypothetical protein
MGRRLESIITLVFNLRSRSERREREVTNTYFMRRILSCRNVPDFIGMTKRLQRSNYTLYNAHLLSYHSPSICNLHVSYHVKRQAPV